MTEFEAFQTIIQLPGVDQYILVDSQARVIQHAMGQPDEMAEMVSVCGNCARALGQTRFRHLVFSRDRQDDFFIFPVGKYYLGVLKETSVSPSTLLDRVSGFIEAFLDPEADGHL